MRRLALPGGSALLVALMVAAFIVTGYVGIDFGMHWDEWYHLQGVRGCINKLWLLPDGVSYGGPYFTLGFPVILAHQYKNVLGMLHDLNTVPAAVANDVGNYPSALRFKTEALALIDSPKYVHEVRTLFLAVTSLTVVWIFLASLKLWPRRYGPALAGAAFVAFSWELGYHARWLAIDTPLTQFCALELFLFCGAWRATTPASFVRWYCGAAAAAAATFACKLTGTFAFPPIILTALLHPGAWRWSRRLALVVLGGVIFLLVSFALTPDSFLDPLHFLAVLRTGSSDYNRGAPTDDRWVSGIVEHTARMAEWLLAAVPSPFIPVALCFSLLAVVGLVALLRRETRLTLSWLTLSVAFTLVFARNHLLIVRQYLMFIPFVALCFAGGTKVAWDFITARRFRRLAPALAVLIAAGMLGNAIFEFRRGWRVTRDTPAILAVDVAHDLLADRRPVRMSRVVLDRIRTHLGDAYFCYPSNVKDENIPHFLAMNIEHEWRSNRVRGFLHFYGAAEMNLNYYTPWYGRLRGERIVDVSMAAVKEQGRVMIWDMDCYPKGSVAPGPPPDAGAPKG